jgi:hypothetical protein
MLMAAQRSGSGGAVDAHGLLAMPYDQRRIIVVTNKLPAAPSVNSRTIRLIAESSLLAFGLTGAAVRALIKARNQMQEAGETLLPISSADASQLHFPIGHPRKNVVYIGHPVDPPTYIPVADFHRFLFEHKVAEALRLIRSLGAITVEVVRVEGWDQAIGVNLGAGLPGVDQIDIGASASRERSGGRSVLTTMRLKPTQSPSVPPDLVWLPHEPLWQEVVQARLESGLDSFVLDIRSTDDYGVNASLKALVSRAGLEAGGSFVEHRATIWRLQGTFA